MRLCICVYVRVCSYICICIYLDTYVYISDRISALLHTMQSCISDVKAWATANMPKLNNNKAELMLFTSKRTNNLHNLPTSITIGNAQIPFKKSVKNLGLTLHCHLTMNAHVSNIARTSYFELRRLTSIR